jgi:DNA adenine methylase
MTHQDHEELLDALDAHPGPVVLSGYQNDLYSQRLRHWKTKTHNGRAEYGKIREEVLWLNPVVVNALNYSLF